MKQRFFLIIVVLSVFCLSLSSAYASMVDLTGAKMKFKFDFGNYGGYDGEVQLTPTTQVSQWELLGFTDTQNWGYYLNDGTDIVVEQIKNNTPALIPDLTFTFFNEDLIGDVTGGSGLLATNQGDYNFVYNGQDKSQSTGWVEYKITGKNFNPVPEPATFVLFGLGLMGVAGLSRKKNKKTWHNHYA